MTIAWIVLGLYYLMGGIVYDEYLAPNFDNGSDLYLDYEWLEYSGMFLRNLVSCTIAFYYSVWLIIRYDSKDLEEAENSQLQK